MTDITNQGMNSQEELDRKVHQAIVTNNLRGTIGELKSEVLSIIEAEASRRELAVLDELEKKKEVVRDNDRDDYLFYAVNVAELQAKRQSLKEKSKEIE